MKRLLYRFYVEFAWLFMPMDWCWMSEKYRRKQFYEFIRSETIRLEKEELDRHFQHIRNVQERYK